jgi:hypothetical protein
MRDRNCNLVWTESIYKNGSFYSADGRTSYYISRIYAVKDDNRNKTVICSACGKEVHNTPSAIKTHRNMVNKSNKCFECNYLKHKNSTTLSHKYVLNEDGTYTESTKNKLELKCGMKWSAYDINSEDAKQNCRYAACQNATFKRIEDFWTQYPNAFDEFITVDRIIDTGYKNMCRYSDGVSFTLKGKANLVANTNNQGVCYQFTLRHYRRSYILRYSKKYDKVWIDEYNRFKDLSSLRLSAEKEEAVISKIRALYN